LYSTIALMGASWCSNRIGGTKASKLGSCEAAGGAGEYVTAMAAPEEGAGSDSGAQAFAISSASPTQIRSDAVVGGAQASLACEIRSAARLILLAISEVA
jgi:hypothetical protein